MQRSIPDTPQDHSPGSPAAAPQLGAPVPTATDLMGSTGEEIPLRPEDVVEDREQALRWEDGGYVLRNVTRPTLIPYLPEPENATGAAVLIAPGGAFLMLSMESEGADLAHMLRERGVAAFVLKYRLGDTGQTVEDFTEKITRVFTQRQGSNVVDTSGGHQRLAVDDVERALALIRRRAGEWGVSPSRVSTIGFSAGAYAVTAALASRDSESRPDSIACIYGGRLPEAVAKTGQSLPQLFTAVDVHDPLCAEDVLELIGTWRQAGAPVEGHIYPGMVHGFGVKPTGAATDSWVDRWFEWLDRQSLLSFS
ncbi:alpha/beta hydrolase [Nesterenkonia salmonea]|uniref:Alpha/beta hydrolase n=1 Tax=Nesterenkonia salmonea TaxID=1804987 RepID=A0A5R9BBY3_9MICC|nr:alpha/beta hydrolase [Nesterenkonia salmonea]TLP97057.1 alpha/beta hydrolase [Nesterenkonia salmonea]